MKHFPCAEIHSFIMGKICFLSEKIWKLMKFKHAIAQFRIFIKELLFTFTRHKTIRA